MKKFFLLAILLVAPLAQAGVYRQVIKPAVKATPHVVSRVAHVAWKVLY